MTEVTEVLNGFLCSRISTTWYVGVGYETLNHLASASTMVLILAVLETGSPKLNLNFIGKEQE